MDFNVIGRLSTDWLKESPKVSDVNIFPEKTLVFPAKGLAVGRLYTG
jgi:hypothetical protein